VVAQLMLAPNKESRAAKKTEEANSRDLESEAEARTFNVRRR